MKPDHLQYNTMDRWDQGSDVPRLILYSPIENERENVYSKFLLMKSSKKCLIFSSACYLIIWLMISPKNFGKIDILNI